MTSDFTLDPVDPAAPELVASFGAAHFPGPPFDSQTCNVGFNMAPGNVPRVAGEEAGGFVIERDPETFGSRKMEHHIQLWTRDIPPKSRRPWSGWMYKHDTVVGGVMMQRGTLENAVCGKTTFLHSDGSTPWGRVDSNGFTARGAFYSEVNGDILRGEKAGGGPHTILRFDAGNRVRLNMHAECASDGDINFGTSFTLKAKAPGGGQHKVVEYGGGQLVLGQNAEGWNGTFFDAPAGGAGHVFRVNGETELQMAGAGFGCRLGRAGGKFGALGAPPVTRPVVTGACDPTSALGSTIAALAALGWVENATTWEP